MKLVSMSDWIKRWYKENFKQFSVKAPKEVWGKIAISLNKWPKHWYKKNTEQLNIKQKPSNWVSLEEKLQSVGLQQNNVYKGVFNYVRRVTIILTLLILPIKTSDYLWDFNQKINYTSSVAQSKEVISKKSLARKNNFADKTISNREKTDINKNSTLKENKLDNSKAEKYHTNKEEELQQPENNQNTVSKIESSNSENEFAELDFKLKPEVSTPKSKLIQLELNINEVKKDKNSLFINAGTSLQKATFINPISQRTLKENNELSKGFNIAFSLGVEKYLSENSSLKFNLFFGDKKSQGFKNTEGNETYKSYIEASYISGLLSYSQNVFKIKDKWKFNVNSGLFFSYLTNTVETENEIDIQRVTSGFNNFDIGLSAGLSADYRLSKNTYLFGDLNYNLGAANIFKGTETIPREFFRTHTSSLFFTLGVKRAIF